jgi:hypothetical protein
MTEQLLARQRQPHTLAGALKQARCAELRFERAYLLAHSRLGEAEPGRGSRETAGIRDGQERSKMIGVEHQLQHIAAPYLERPLQSIERQLL